jgi:hypothetical protein
MIQASSISFRHKLGIFTTVTTIGIALLMEVSWKPVIGLLLLGATLTWAIGTPNRLLRWAILIACLGIMLFPLLQNVTERFRMKREYDERLARFRDRLPLIAQQHPDLTAGIVFDPKDPYAPYQVKTIDVPNVGQVNFPVKMTSQEIAAALRKNSKQLTPPNWYLEALDAGIDAKEINGLEDSPAWEVVTPSATEAIKEGAGVEAVGAVFVAIFGGTLIADYWIGRRRGQSGNASSQ